MGFSALALTEASSALWHHWASRSGSSIAQRSGPVAHRLVATEGAEGFAAGGFEVRAIDRAWTIERVSAIRPKNRSRARQADPPNIRRGDAAERRVELLQHVVEEVRRDGHVALSWRGADDSAMSLTIRPATPSDTGLIHNFVRALAEYENLLHEVEATEADIAGSLFGANLRLFCDIAEADGTPVGFAVWFYNYSTFTGRHGIWLETCR